MYFYRARYYSPALGRFISRDPIEYDDGMNLYEYVRGMAADGVDPMGLLGGTVFSWLFGGGARGRNEKAAQLQMKTARREFEKAKAAAQKAIGKGCDATKHIERAEWAMKMLDDIREGDRRAADEYSGAIGIGLNEGANVGMDFVEDKMKFGLDSEVNARVAGHRDKGYGYLDYTSGVAAGAAATTGQVVEKGIVVTAKVTGMSIGQSTY